jgi:hypothetical protein
LGGIWVSNSFKTAIKELLKYYEESHGKCLSPLQFNSLMNRFQQMKSVREATDLIDNTIAKGWKNPVFPDEVKP